MTISYSKPGFETCCPRCRMFQVQCLCPEMPHLKLKTRLILFAHRSELNKLTNSGMLAHQVLENSKVVIRGDKNKRTPDTLDFESPPNSTHYVLFPDLNAEVLTPEFAKRHDVPITLICPDGHWSQAKKIVQREDSLKNLRRVQLPEGLVSNYRLRRNVLPGRVCTFEAIMLALGIIEGDEIREKMEVIFRKMVSRVLWGRGKTKEIL